LTQFPKIRSKIKNCDVQASATEGNSDDDDDNASKNEPAGESEDEDAEDNNHDNSNSEEFSDGGFEPKDAFQFWQEDTIFTMEDNGSHLSKEEIQKLWDETHPLVKEV
jgi:hypothetical protein